LRMSRKSRSLRPVPHERSVNSEGKPVPTVAGGVVGGGAVGTVPFGGKAVRSYPLPMLMPNIVQQYFGLILLV